MLPQADRPLKECPMSLTKLHSWFTRMAAKVKRRRQPGDAKPTRRRLPLLLERLEERTVPTVLFAPQFGTESIAADGGQRISSPNVYVVLWGSSWGSLDSPNVRDVFSATSGVVEGHYLDGLSQYGVTTTAHYKDHFVDTADPVNGFTQQNMVAEIERLIANKQLPDPGKTPNMIVDVVTPFGIISNPFIPFGCISHGVTRGSWSSS